MVANDPVTLWRYRGLLRRLVARDLRIKYKGSALGFGWSLLNPLLMAAVYTIAFRYVLHVQTPYFPLFLLSGLMPWTFHSTALTSATGAVVDSGSLVRKVAFPRMLLPMAAVATQFVQFIAMYTIVVPLAVVAGPGATSTLLLVVPLALLQCGFVVGLALVSTTLYVSYRDVRHLLDVVLQVWFWVTPIVYPLALVPDGIRAFVSANPMAAFVTSYHQLVVEQTLPSAAQVGVLVLSAAASLGLGVLVFTRHESRFAELV